MSVICLIIGLFGNMNDPRAHVETKNEALWSGSVRFAESCTFLQADPSEGAADPPRFDDSYTFLKSDMLRIRLTDPRIRHDLTTVSQIGWFLHYTPCRFYNTK